MKMTDFVPAELIPALTWLGTQDWLKYRSVANGRTEITSSRIPIPQNVPHLHQALSIVARTNGTRLFTINALSKALALGPKLLRPTEEQCHAMENVDINVPFANYQQPYPAVFLELPAEYRNALSKRFGIQSPKHVLAYHDSETGYLLVIAFSVGAMNDIAALMPPRPEHGTIEVALKASLDTGTDIDLAELVQRIALNLCLLMTHYGVEEDGPSNPGQVKALQRAMRHRKQSKAAQAKSLLAVVPTLISFKQEIKFCTEANRTTSNGDEHRILGDGTPKKPHWRRGYFRNQRIGPGRVETKLTFIPPVFVNSDHFCADLKDTEVVYKG